VQDVAELFAHIDRYKPHALELSTKLKPFIPDFIPSVGEIDPFLKPARPDGDEDLLGLARLDEPAPQQSDATVLELQLRALSKKSNLEPTFVRSIPDASKNPREIQKWIDSIEDLHRSKPAPQVRYSKPMPDIESLMQEWPEEVEAAISKAGLPSADIDLTLEEYSRVACALTGIPVHSSTTLVQSLHVLFTLYSEFRANQHFGMAPAAAGGQ
jgi:intraflagellar transport protein 46